MYQFPGGSYRARHRRVIDGDTLDLTFDVGFHVQALVRVRLLGIDTPELNAEDPTERARAVQARDYVHAILDQLTDEWPLRVDGLKKDTDHFGRWLARVHWLAADGEHDLATDLVMAGLAVVYPR
jgi:endonuclease YncB( thermonuclease family)